MSETARIAANSATRSNGVSWSLSYQCFTRLSNRLPLPVSMVTTTTVAQVKRVARFSIKVAIFGEVFTPMGFQILCYSSQPRNFPMSKLRYGPIRRNNHISDANPLATHVLPCPTMSPEHQPNTSTMPDLHGQARSGHRAPFGHPKPHGALHGPSSECTGIIGAENATRTMNKTTQILATMVPHLIGHAFSWARLFKRCPL